jgi:hypothetical protein
MSALAALAVLAGLATAAVTIVNLRHRRRLVRIAQVQVFVSSDPARVPGTAVRILRTERELAAARAHAHALGPRRHRPIG